MNFMNGPGSKKDVHQQAKDYLQGGNKDLAQHNFFAPLNELDPLTKPKAKMEFPVFKYRIFHLSGSENSPEEGSDYADIMNKIARGECQLLDDHVYHSHTTGDIRVFVRWLELPKSLQFGSSSGAKPPPGGSSQDPEAGKAEKESQEEVLSKKESSEENKGGRPRHFTDPEIMM